MKDFYRSILGIPASEKTLPVISFILLGMYSRNIILIISAIILGIGHTDIHINHKKSFNNFILLF